MRRNPSLYFLLIAVALILSIPVGVGIKLRGFFASEVIPSKHLHKQEEAEELARENRFLRRLVDDLTAELLKQKSLAQIKGQQLDHLLSVPAHVIHRDPAMWSSFLWIDVGAKHNEILGEEIIAKNSPVVSGDILVGVVEQVEKSRSLVRLVTDRDLVPSVRVVSKEEFARPFSFASSLLSRTLAMCRAELPAIEQTAELHAEIEKITLSLGNKVGNSPAIYGELHGTSTPLWRGRSSVLRGSYFHTSSSQQLKIEEGALLVTTGFDGVFPPDLLVAKVLSVDERSEGAPSISLSAEAAAGDLFELRNVHVLPRCK